MAESCSYAVRIKLSYNAPNLRAKGAWYALVVRLRRSPRSEDPVLHRARSAVVVSNRLWIRFRRCHALRVYTVVLCAGGSRKVSKEA